MICSFKIACVVFWGFQSHGSRTILSGTQHYQGTKGPAFGFFVSCMNFCLFLWSLVQSVFACFYSTQLVGRYLFRKKNVRIIISLYKKGEVSLVGYQSIKSIFVIVRIKIFPLTSHAWTSPTNSCWIDCMPNNLYVAFQEVELLVHDSMFNLGCCIWLAGLDLEIFAWRTPTLWYFRSTFF